jgi:hypothetical protein
MALPKIISALQDLIARFTLTAAPGKTPQGNESDGRIDVSWLPAVIKSGGNTSNTGYQIADGSDLAELFGKLKGVENTTSGSGSFVSGVTLSVSGANVRLTQSKATPGYCGYCSHCGYCSYCTNCTYCTYCTYCSNCGNCSDCSSACCGG